MALHASFSALGVVALSAVAYVLYTAAYRLWFHPLAKFPGPKLAALTTWYEGYYDCLRYKGRFTFQLEALHKRYGNTHAPCAKTCYGIMMKLVADRHRPHRSYRTQRAPCQGSGVPEPAV